MHSDLARALAKARQDDLLNTYPTRRLSRARLNERRTLFTRSRHGLGSLLIRTGVFLIGDRRAEIELAN
jgi:hypothetical protein